MKKKTIIILSAIIFLVLLIIFILVINNNTKETEKDYVSEFTKIAEDAYSNYYYQVLLKDKSAEAVKEFVKGYESKGLTFDLEALKGYAINEDKGDYLDIINEFLNNNKSCNESKTKVIIYPKDPYLSTDFTSVVNLNCEIK